MAGSVLSSSALHRASLLCMNWRTIDDLPSCHTKLRSEKYHQNSVMYGRVVNETTEGSGMDAIVEEMVQLDSWRRVISVSVTRKVGGGRCFCNCKSKLCNQSFVHS